MPRVDIEKNVGFVAHVVEEYADMHSSNDGPVPLVRPAVVNVNVAKLYRTVDGEKSRTVMGFDADLP